MKYPAWYYKTTPDPRYPGIDEKVRGLVYLLRNNGWNTTACCGSEYEGIIIIDLYGEQMGWMLDHGGPVRCLRVFLKSHGYEHFEITYQDWIMYGHAIEQTLILKILDTEWLGRWK